MVRRKNVMKVWKMGTQLFRKYDDDEGILIVPNWLIEVFAFIKRKEMIQKNSHYASLPISCRIFNKLCWPILFGNVQPHSIPYLSIRLYKTYYDRLQIVTSFNNEQTWYWYWNVYPQIPRWFLNPQNSYYLPSYSSYAKKNLYHLPTTPPPKYITGFGRIDLMYLDDQIIEFLFNILPSLNSIKLIIDLRDSHWSKRHWIPAIGHLIKMMAPKIGTFKLHISLANLAAFNRIFPSILPTIQCMALELEDTDFNLLIEWLLKMERKSPAEPRILNLCYNMRVNRCQKLMLIELIKEEFIHSNKPICFLIFPIYADDFTMKNEKTGEILRLSDQHLIRQARGEQMVNNPIEQKQNDGSTTIYVGITEIVKIIKPIN